MKRLPANAVDVFFSLAEKGLLASQTANSAYADESLADYKVAHELIRVAVTRSEEYLPNPYFRSLSQPLEIAVNLGHGSLDYWWLFQCVRDALNQTNFVAELEDEDAWVAALEVAARYRRITTIDVFTQNAFTRSANVARSLSRLKAEGYEYEITPKGVGLTYPSFEKAAHDIEALVQAIGGARVAATIFNFLKTNNRIYRGLFLYGRSVSQLPEARDPTVPWHYLYNLAVKHLATAPTSRDVPNDWAKLVTLAQDFGASIDVEDYYGFGFMGISPYFIDRVVQDNVVYDELFSFQQWSADGAVRLFDLWTDALVETKCAIPVATHEQWRALTKAVLDRAMADQIAIVPVWDLWTPDLPTDLFLKMIESISISATEINRGYSTPIHTKERTAPLYPLINVGRGNYFLPPRGILARSLYERLFGLMRTVSDPRIETKLGRALERVVTIVLRESGNGPSVIAGKYSFPFKRNQYELDLAVETDSHIHFLECKRKSLTNPARGGAPADALLDISHSFLEMLVQLLRHEIALRTKGSIVFKDKKVLSLNGRDVERIAVTMLDYGSLQNPILTRSIVQAILGSKFDSDDAATSARLESINETVRELHTKLQELSRLGEHEFGEFLHRLSFGTWWLSMDQLAVLSQENKSLWEMFRPIRHVIFQTGDIMNEFSIAHRMGIGQTPAVILEERPASTQ